MSDDTFNLWLFRNFDLHNLEQLKAEDLAEARKYNKLINLVNVILTLRFLKENKIGPFADKPTDKSLNFFQRAWNSIKLFFIPGKNHVEMSQIVGNLDAVLEAKNTSRGDPFEYDFRFLAKKKKRAKNEDEQLHTYADPGMAEKKAAAIAKALIKDPEKPETVDSKVGVSLATDAASGMGAGDTGDADGTGNTDTTDNSFETVFKQYFLKISFENKSRAVKKERAIKAAEKACRDGTDSAAGESETSRKEREEHRKALRRTQAAHLGVEVGESIGTLQDHSRKWLYYLLFFPIFLLFAATCFFQVLAATSTGFTSFRCLQQLPRDLFYLYLLVG